MYFPPKRGPDYKPDLQTCETCGAVYDLNDDDWSGPAHGHNDCIAKLQADLATAIARGFWQGVCAQKAREAPGCGCAFCGCAGCLKRGVTLRRWATEGA